MQDQKENVKMGPKEPDEMKTSYEGEEGKKTSDTFDAGFGKTE